MVINDSFDEIKNLDQTLSARGSGRLQYRKTFEDGKKILGYKQGYFCFRVNRNLKGYFCDKVALLLHSSVFGGEMTAILKAICASTRYLGACCGVRGGKAR